MGKKGEKGLIKNKKAQVWIETVIYTLIAFVMIGLVLTYAKPKIEEIQDKAIVEQSLEIIENIHAIILSIVQGGAGNTRLIEINLKKGALKIDGENNKIEFELESTYAYSQPGETINYGNIDIMTKEKGEINLILLTKDYDGEYNIKYDGEDILKTLSKASTPYKIYFSNKGEDGGRIIINIEIL